MDQVIHDASRASELPVDESYENEFYKSGDIWIVRFKEERTYITGRCIGALYISKLLGSPYQVFTLHDLLPASNERHKLDDLGEFGEVGIGSTADRWISSFDKKSMFAVQREKVKLVDQIREAEASDDYDRFDRIDQYHNDLKLLCSYSMDAMIKHNKQQKNAADAVRKAINESIKKLERYHPSVAAHFRKYIRTGYKLQYAPVERADWKVL
jgi:hypothetical protein